MSEPTHESENVVEVEDFEITDEAIEDFIHSEPAGPSYHTILQVWREVLEPAADAAKQKPGAGYSNKIITSYPEVTYNDMVIFSDSFYGKIEELRQILLAEIESDENSLKHLTAEEDAEFNGQHYRNVMRDWQVAMVGWENEWDCLRTDAGVELAAISEVHKMFFGQTGLTSMLDNIPFEFTEAHQQELADALQAAKAAE